MIGIELYVETGVDENGLMRFRCLRGTNVVEGMHQKVVNLIGPYQRGLKLAFCQLEDFRHNCNLRAAVRSGRIPPMQHFDMKLTDDIQTAFDDLYDKVSHRIFPNPRDVDVESACAGLVQPLTTDTDVIQVLT